MPFTCSLEIGISLGWGCRGRVLIKARGLTFREHGGAEFGVGVWGVGRLGVGGQGLGVRVQIQGLVGREF